MPVLERILSMGITGSGKSYQWLKLAEALQPTGSIFRVLDTDNDVPFMLQTQFKHLSNVHVQSCTSWPEFKAGVDWLKKENIKPDDWLIVDKANAAWETVQRYFTEEVFGEDIGDYFLMMRKQIEQRGGKDRFGKTATSVAPEAFDGWKDWAVINKLYDDWIKPIVYQVKCHVYAATDVERLDRGEKDSELVTLFGDMGVRPSGQKRLGGQMHSIFLLIPGKDNWLIATVKDRGGRTYFKRTPLTSIYLQYLVAKAGWPMVKKEG